MSEVRIIAKNPPIDITVPMGDGAATPTGGLGGWKTVERTEDVDLSVWEGQANLAQDVPIMLDGWGIHPRSIQPELDTIYRLGLPSPNSAPPSPPVFQVWGPVRFPGKWWVLPESGIELSTDEDEVILDRDGTPYRQALTLHMVAYSHDVFGKKRRPGSNKGRGDQSKGPAIGKAVPLTHTTGKNETFGSIATDLYGEWLHWQEIAVKNPGYPHTPFEQLPPSRTLVL